MQNLWSRVLAGEANNPGRYSKRTVNLMSSLDKVDAELQEALLIRLANRRCGAADLRCQRYDIQRQRDTLQISAATRRDQADFISGFGWLPETGPPTDGGRIFLWKPFVIEFQQQENNSLNLGTVLLSQAGQELAPICESARCPGFQEYVVAKWQAMGIVVREVT
jgi:Protein of unknown function (DUF2806)